MSKEEWEVLHIHLLQCALPSLSRPQRDSTQTLILKARGTKLGRFGNLSTFGEYVFQFGGNVTVLFSPIFLIAGLLPLHGLIPGMVLVLKSAAVYFGRLGLTNESQLLIPSFGLPLTTKSLAAVTIPKEGIQGWGGGGTYVRCPQGSCV